jgi:hypothetical protein
MSVEFRYLELDHYNNEPHFRRFAAFREARIRECTVLLPAGVEPKGLFEAFLGHVLQALDRRVYLPIARFCDGEYRFYSGRKTTTCWGERESDLTADGVQGLHLHALRIISQQGLLCPNLNLVYVETQSDFLDFLARNGMPLQNYVPFYFVYALLANPRLNAALQNRHVAVISHLGNKNVRNIERCFSKTGASRVTFHDLPPSGVAHGRFELNLAERPDIAFVGAGIGAPLVLERLQPLGCVAIDAGFVLHLWDGTFDQYERLFLNHE